MDISVKKLSEILKIDPEVLLSKMIDAGLSHKSVDDLVSTQDKQKLLSYIRSSKDAPAKPTAAVEVTPPVPSPQPQPKKESKPSPKVTEKPKQKPKVEKEPEEDTKVKKTVNINGSIRVNDLSRKLSRRGNEVVKKLMELGEMASLNDEIDQETAVLVAEEFGFQVNFEEEQKLSEE